MDFENLEADKDLILDKHYTPGRGGHEVDKVIIHYNAADLTVEGCYSVWQTRPASAHYQVESDGTVGQLVWEADTAWHAGNWHANQTSIGIEHANQGSHVTPECIESGAHLVAALCKAYGLGEPEWGENVFGHNRFAATDCPGPLEKGTEYHDAFMDRAKEWYAIMSGNTGKWVKYEDGWWYERADGSYPKSEWEQIDGEWYFFDEKGYMLTGWLKRGKKWYYLAGSGRMITGWQQVGKDWYLLGADGAMLTGWQKPKDDWYLLDDEGRMLTGWQERGGEWYYLSTAHDGSYGHMVAGALSLHGDTYVLAPDGRMLHDCVAVAGGRAYLLGPKGDAVKGAVSLTAGDDGALVAHA